MQADAKSLAVQNAVIDVAGWRAEGETDLGLEPLQPRRVLLRQLRGPLGDLTADLALDGSRWRGRVDIGRLDVRPLLQDSGTAAAMPRRCPTSGSISPPGSCGSATRRSAI